MIKAEVQIKRSISEGYNTPFTQFLANKFFKKYALVLLTQVTATRLRQKGAHTHIYWKIGNRPVHVYIYYMCVCRPQHRHILAFYARRLSCSMQWLSMEIKFIVYWWKLRCCNCPCICSCKNVCIVVGACKLFLFYYNIK